MIMTTARIEVKGDHATADVVWTGTVTTKVTDAPHFAEQGQGARRLRQGEGANG